MGERVYIQFSQVLPKGLLTKGQMATLFPDTIEEEKKKKKCGYLSLVNTQTDYSVTYETNLATEEGVNYTRET